MERQASYSCRYSPSAGTVWTRVEGEKGTKPCQDAPDAWRRRRIRVSNGDSGTDMLDAVSEHAYLALRAEMGMFVASQARDHLASREVKEIFVFQMSHEMEPLAEERNLNT